MKRDPNASTDMTLIRQSKHKMNLHKLKEPRVGRPRNAQLEEFKDNSFIYRPQNTFSIQHIPENQIRTVDPDTEERAAALDELKAEQLELVAQLMQQHLTQHQLKVYDLVFVQNMTYKVAAAQLGVCFTAIPNCLLGIKKKDEKTGERYYSGGILIKLKKVFNASKEYQAIINKIRNYDSLEE